MSHDKNNFKTRVLNSVHDKQRERQRQKRINNRRIKRALSMSRKRGDLRIVYDHWESLPHCRTGRNTITQTYYYFQLLLLA